MDWIKRGERLKHNTPSPITLNFPVSMWSYMEYLGENTNKMQTYSLIVTLCGDTYRAGLELTDDKNIFNAAENFGYTCRLYATRQRDTNYMSESELTKRTHCK